MRMHDGRPAERRRRPIAEAGVAIRDSAGGGSPTFAGRAILYDTRTSIGNPLRWGFYEEIAQSAATKTLQEGDARFLVDHLTEQPVSRVSAGTLRLAESAAGVDVDSDLNVAKSYVSDLVENLRDGTVTGMSFGFLVVRDEWLTVRVETTDGDTVDADLRRVLELRLLEVSAVTFPAYEDTTAGLRSVELALRSSRDPHALDLVRARRDVLADVAPDLVARAGDGHPPDTTTGGLPAGPPDATTGRDAARLLRTRTVRTRAARL